MPQSTSFAAYQCSKEGLCSDLSEVFPELTETL